MWGNPKLFQGMQSIGKNIEKKINIDTTNWKKLFDYSAKNTNNVYRDSLTLTFLFVWNNWPMKFIPLFEILEKNTQLLSIVIDLLIHENCDIIAEVKLRQADKDFLHSW